MLLLLGAALSAAAQSIALTFDDLPEHGPLPPGTTRLDVAHAVLQTLRAERMPPVYGMANGAAAADEPEAAAVLRAWREAGEPLGNHTWSHMDLNAHTAAAFAADVAREEAVLRAGADGGGTGEDGRGGGARWFRYPYLREGDSVRKRRAVRAYLAGHGYRVAEVTMDFGDYLWNEPYARCAERHDVAAIARLEQMYLDAAATYAGYARGLSRRLYGREIAYVLLLHLGAFDAHMLPRLVGQYRAEGFRFVPLEKAEADAAYKDDPGLPMQHGATLLEQMTRRRGLPLPAEARPFRMLEGMCR